MQLYEMTWPQVQDLDINTPVVIPVAALEQHGHHMPLFTDSLLLGEVLRRASDRLQSDVLFTPLMWLGNSEHHLDFPGTMTASPRTYLDLLKEMVENFLAHGFQRFVILNGHGGNIVPSQQALFELRQDYREFDSLLLIAATYWDMAAVPADGFHQQQMGHACEWETSMMLALRPDLVGDIADLQPVEFGSSFKPGHRAWITRERTETGHIGFPHLATKEKGEQLFQMFADGTVDFLKRVAAWDGTTWDA